MGYPDTDPGPLIIWEDVEGGAHYIALPPCTQAEWDLTDVDEDGNTMFSFYAPGMAGRKTTIVTRDAASDLEAAILVALGYQLFETDDEEDESDGGVGGEAEQGGEPPLRLRPDEGAGC